MLLAYLLVFSVVFFSLAFYLHFLFSPLGIIILLLVQTMLSFIGKRDVEESSSLITSWPLYKPPYRGCTALVLYKPPYRGCTALVLYKPPYQGCTALVLYKPPYRGCTALVVYTPPASSSLFSIKEDKGANFFLKFFSKNKKILYVAGTTCTFLVIGFGVFKAWTFLLALKAMQQSPGTSPSEKLGIIQKFQKFIYRLKLPRGTTVVALVVGLILLPFVYSYVHNELTKPRVLRGAVLPVPRPGKVKVTVKPPVVTYCRYPKYTDRYGVAGSDLDIKQTEIMWYFDTIVVVPAGLMWFIYLDSLM